MKKLLQTTILSLVVVSAYAHAHHIGIPNTPSVLPQCDSLEYIITFSEEDSQDANLLFNELKDINVNGIVDANYLLELSVGTFRVFNPDYLQHAETCLNNLLKKYEIKNFDIECSNPVNPQPKAGGSN